MDITKNGAGQSATPQAAMITTSWMRDDFANGRRRFKLYAMHVPVMQAVDPAMHIGLSHPRLAGAPAVIGEMTVEVPNLEVARILHAAMAEMLSKQPPEILQVKSVPVA